MPKPFLTPPVSSDVLECRTLLIPNTKEWLGIFNSALLETVYYWNYEQVNDTDLTPEETAEACRAIVWEYFDASCGAGEVPAPYWDNPEDVDDEATPEEQPWYGRVEGLDFVEEIGIWAITGFIAYSGNIGAAIAFKTFAPKFALAWKRGGVAAAVRVFIDGVDTGTLEIGSGEGIVEHDYIGDPDLDEHDIMVVLESVA